MKLRKVNSAYKNPDRLIHTLRRKVERFKTKDNAYIKMLEKRIATMEHNAGRAIIDWNPGAIEKQTMNVLSPNDIHVGVGIVQIGRIIKVEEDLSEKGQPQSSFTYELKTTKVLPTVQLTGHELKDIEV